MLVYNGPNRYLLENCNKQKFNISNKIPYYIDIDPFLIELRIINFQLYFRNKIVQKKNKFIIYNINKVINYEDPLTKEIILKNKHLQVDINLLYPILIKEFIYLYKLESLNLIINNNCKEIITNTDLNQEDINKIKYLCKKFNINIEEEEFTQEELFHFKKINTFQKLDILGTYFPLNIYNNLSLQEKTNIYVELKLMWNAFCIDNNISDKDLFNKKLIWSNNDNVDKNLIEKINFLLDDNLDINLKKMISYLIIGAFSYVNNDIKKIYNNINFI